MPKLRTTVLALLLSVAGAASAAAGYSSASIGVPGQFYFSESTTYLHDGSPAPMGGITGRTSTDGGAAWYQARADGGHKAGKHGFELNLSENFHVFCHAGDFVSGFQGWYTSSGGIWGLQIRCRGDNTPSYGLIALLGKKHGTYKAVSCSNQDIAWGVYGGEGPFLMRTGLVCDPYP